jgi:hypothetical protein
MENTERLEAMIAGLQVQVAHLTALVQHGVTPPQWVDGRSLALALGLKPRAAEYYRKDLGVLPVDGKVCRRAGKSYEYNLEECRKLIEEYKRLGPQAQAAYKRSEVA